MLTFLLSPSLPVMCVSADFCEQSLIRLPFFYSQELGDVVYVDLPEAGTEVKALESFGSVESVKAASSVYAPVDVQVRLSSGQM